MSDTDQLAQQIAECVCESSMLGLCPPEIIALAIIENVPCLQSATEAESQIIFDALIGALAARQVARITARTARFVA